MQHPTIIMFGFLTRTRRTLFALGLIAAVFLIPAMAAAQDALNGAVMVNVVSPSDEELKAGAPKPDWGKNMDKMTLYNHAQFLTAFKRNPFFTPDSQWIVFDDLTFGAWMVPVGGGAPRLACDWYFNFVYDNATPVSHIIGGYEGINRTFGPSPDGKEIAGMKKVIDLENGTIAVPAGESGYYYQNLVWTLVSQNIETGAEKVIAVNAFQGRWSHDGRYFVYVKRDPTDNGAKPSWDNLFSYEKLILGLYVKDLTTGSEKSIASVAVCPCFTPDDSAIICSMKDQQGLWQIFSIPRTGGVPKQLSFYGPDDTGRNARVSDVSPDGKWVIHTGDFTVGSATKTGLCVCNIATGVSYPFFPDVSTITTEGSWSPDGNKIVFSAGIKYLRQGAVRDGYAIYIMDFDPEVFSKPTAVAETLPVGFAITGNLPNPFNPSTTIFFTLPEAGTANVAVYDITGRKVRDLVSESLTAGVHSTVWDGRDSSGRPSSSGVYFTRLFWNGRSTASRMILAK
jgi:Tol biopolymer transport system component